MVNFESSISIFVFCIISKYFYIYFMLIHCYVILVSRAQVQTTAAPKRMHAEDIPGDITAERLLAIVDSNPHIVEQFKDGDSELHAALVRKDLGAIRMALMARFLESHKRSYAKQKELAAIEADPMNEENQRKIEEAIRNENIMQNMEMAIENLPEAFGRVQMLYVPITINGHSIKAFVDSGAQSTIMSEKCAERCNIMRLLDKRFAGEARGVGTAKILGRIHIAQMKFGASFYPVSITVLEKSDIDMLFGLDTLRRYNCVIDLGRNVLRVNNGYDSKGEPLFEELSFLGDAEIPQSDIHGDTKPTATSSASASNGGDQHSSGNKASSSTISPITPAPTATAAGLPAVAGSGVAAASNGAAIAAGGGANTDAKVRELTALGFSPQQAQAALAQAGGDVSLAASLLMEML